MIDWQPISAKRLVLHVAGIPVVELRIVNIATVYDSRAGW